jgi:hypothetical protein
MEHGFAPFAPHLLYPQFLDDSVPTEREAGIVMGLAVLERCSELWCFGEDVTTGMSAEISKASALGMPIQFHGKGVVQ